jgi:hypothetical protein
LESLSELLVSHRHKVYLPKNIDLIEYDRLLFLKLMDMEIMRVSNKTEKREVTRERNESGMFRRLKNELT